MDMDDGGTVQDAIEWLSLVVQKREGELKKEKEHVTELMSVMASSREQHKSEVAALKEELGEMLNREKEEAKKLEEELKSSKEKHKSEVAELNKGASDLEKMLKREKEEVKMVKEELKSSKEEHKRELAELKKEVSELGESLKREREQMKKVEKELKSSREDHKQEVKELRRETLRVEEKYDELHKEHIRNKRRLQWLECREADERAVAKQKKMRMEGQLRRNVRIEEEQRAIVREEIARRNSTHEVMSD